MRRGRGNLGLMDLFKSDFQRFAEKVVQILVEQHRLTPDNAVAWTHERKGDVLVEFEVNSKDASACAQVIAEKYDAHWRKCYAAYVERALEQMTYYGWDKAAAREIVAERAPLLLRMAKDHGPYQPIRPLPSTFIFVLEGDHRLPKIVRDTILKARKAP
jgi:hypothetical protein